ncbi:hypothetical protein ACSLST_01795 [Klebsiella pneumoniae]|uniref:hypothetical protein n=1 Tax=Klebsiella pneumoniae TaxID=573 RepID=UPI003EE07C91
MQRDERRRVIYCLPFILCEDDICFGHVIIKPIRNIINNDVCKELLSGEVFENNGCVIEIDGFKSGDYYDKNIDLKIGYSIEALKTSYFYLSPSSSMDIRGFIGNETFECFKIFERSKSIANIHFEHKIQMSNGMTNFSFSLDKYYKFRSEFLNNFKLKVRESDFSHFNVFYDKTHDDSILSILTLYNKCWGLYSAKDFYDKALYSRVSIEVLSKLKCNNSNKSIPESFGIFFSEVKNLIEHHDFTGKDERFLYEIYENKIKPCFYVISKRIEKYFLDLAGARNYIAHEGKEHPSFFNISPYLVFFPVFFIILSRKSEISNCDIYRFVFLLGLFMHDVNTWDKIDFREIRPKRSHLDSYLNFARVYPHYLKNENESAHYLLKGFINFLNDSKGHNK